MFITTDDQRADEMRWMPYTRELLGGHGVTFSRGLSPHPLCCPARAEWVTGQYGHNNGVHHNAGKHGGFPALLDPADTLGTWLSRAGYRTAMVGKYMNGYHASDGAQPGWTHWNATVERVYSYRNTTFFNDGDPVLHAEHVDDAVTGYARDYIREFAESGDPFFVWASNLAPHTTAGKGGFYPPIPADRHKSLFAGVQPRTVGKPSYGVSVRGWEERPTKDEKMREVAVQHRARIRSLQAVDEQVRDIVATLREVGELENTYIVFTSDNGYLLGEHNLLTKNRLYAESLEVPLLVRVPGQEAAVRSEAPVTLVDVAPTFVDLAGSGSGNRIMDGVSFLPLLTGAGQEWRDTQLVQTGRRGRNAFGTDTWDLRGVRTARYTYAVRQATGEELLLDRTRDRFERFNLAGLAAYRPVLRDLRARYRVLSDCAGAECAVSFGPEPEPSRRGRRAGGGPGGRG